VQLPGYSPWGGPVVVRSGWPGCGACGLIWFQPLVPCAWVLQTRTGWGSPVAPSAPSSR